jgi:hypothetical protein
MRGTTAALTVTGGPEAAALDGGCARIRASGVLDRTTVGIRSLSFLGGWDVVITIDDRPTPGRR